MGDQNSNGHDGAHLEALRLDIHLAELQLLRAELAQISAELTANLCLDRSTSISEIEDKLIKAMQLIEQVAARQEAACRQLKFHCRT